MIAAITMLQLINGVLVLAFLFIGFKLLETSWSYKISKPFQWEEAVRKGGVSKRLKRIERFYRDKVRFYTLWFQVERLKKMGIPGAFAEVGVYKGETARMLHAMDPSRPFHLFDTFEGFSKQDLDETIPDQRNNFVDFSDTSVDTVLKFIGGNENITVHKGYFPDTTAGLTTEKYALVHLDADLYNPTRAALEYFYSRISAGGVIIIHDYNHSWEGVHKAVNEFVASIPEFLTEIPDWQGSVMIVKSKISQPT